MIEGGLGVQPQFQNAGRHPVDLRREGLRHRVAKSRVEPGVMHPQIFRRRPLGGDDLLLRLRMQDAHPVDAGAPVIVFQRAVS